MSIRDNENGKTMTLKNVPVKDLHCIVVGGGPFGQSRHTVHIDGAPWRSCNREGDS